MVIDTPDVSEVRFTLEKLAADPDTTRTRLEMIGTYAAQQSDALSGALWADAAAREAGRAEAAEWRIVS